MKCLADEKKHGHVLMTQRPITARMCIGAPLGHLGLGGAAARRSATCPLGLVGLGATSPTCDTIWDIAPSLHCSVDSSRGAGRLVSLARRMLEG